MKNTDTDELCPAILRILIFLPPALSSITLIFKAVLYCNCTDAHFYKTLIMRSLFNGRFLKYECETSNFEKYSEKGRRPASAVGLYENFLKNSNFLKIFFFNINSTHSAIMLEFSKIEMSVRFSNAFGTYIKSPFLAIRLASNYRTSPPFEIQRYFNGHYRAGSIDFFPPFFPLFSSSALGL